MEMKVHSTVSVTEFSVWHSGFQDTLQVPALQNTVSPDEKTPMGKDGRAQGLNRRPPELLSVSVTQAIMISN